MDELQELLARLNGEGEPLNDDELADLRTRLEARAAELGEDDSDEALEELRGIRDATQAIDGETTRRTEAAEARRTEREQLLGEIQNNGDEGDGEGSEDNDGSGNGDGNDGDQDSEGGDSESTGDTGDGSGTGDGEPGTGAEGQPQSRAASGARRPASRPRIRDAARQTPARQVPRPEPDESQRATIIAASGAPRVEMGTELTIAQLMDQTSEAWRLQAGMHARPGGTVKTVVATIRTQYPEDRRLDKNNAEANSQRIEALAAAARRLPQSALAAAGGVVDQALVASITAAGGTCAPLPTTYDLGDNISTADRPLRDADVTLNAPRGGVRRLISPQLEDLSDAPFVWTYENDVNPNGADNTLPAVPVGDRLATKPCLRIECPGEDSVMADAIGLCLETGNFNRMTFPELWARWWELGQAALARLAENRHFAEQVRFSSQATAQTGLIDASQVLGASIDVLTAIERIIAALRYRYRMSGQAPIRIKLPEWVRNLLRVDRTRRTRDSDDLALTDEQINAWFTSRNVNPTWLPDANQPIGLDAGQDPQLWPDQFTAVMHHEGAWAHIDAGELDFGTEIRDGERLRTNDVAAFFEVFENTFFTGVWTRAVTFDVCPNGASVGPIDPPVGLCAAGS